jgi:phenylpropionate dioxygenase-like ring-hydroxylating dioxygenase large terminal subunit
MCRHRGGRVETAASGSKRVFMCRYHGWAYDRDGGALRNAPYGEFFDSLDYSCHGLRRIKVEEDHGLIWADFSNNESRSVQDYLGVEASARLAEFDLGHTVPFMEKVLPLDVNWKLVMDGAVDMLHPKFLHPEGVGKLAVTHAAVWREYGRHGQVFSPRKRMEEVAKAFGTVEESYRYYATILRIYPNTLVISAPDHTEFWTVWPSNESATRSTTTIRLYVRPEILDDRMVDRLNRSWAILEQAATQEDFPMELSIQANALTDPEGTFLYGRNEVTCQQLHRQLQKDLAASAPD